MPPRESPAGYFRKDVQGLRAIAVLLVVLYHANFSIPFTLDFKGGFVGVDVFFVISGFVVGGVLVRDLLQGNYHARDFLLRRARRLWPALAVVVAFSLVGAFFLVGVDRVEQVAQTGIWSSLWSGNLYLLADSAQYFESGARTNPLLHTWSLSVEEQFYLLLAVLIVVLKFVASRVRTDPLTILTPTLAILFLASLIHSQMLVQSSESSAFFLPSTRAWEFLAGFLLYIFSHRLRQPQWSGLFGVPFAFIGAGLIGYAAVFYDERSMLFPGISAGIPVGGALLVIYSGLVDKTGFVQAVLGNRPMVFLGNISYGWYLWHWPFVVFADLVWPGNDEIALVVATLAIVPAWLSHRYLEVTRSGRELDTRPFGKKALLAAISIPVAVSIGLLGLERVSFEILKSQNSFLATVKENRELIETELRTPTNFSETPEVLVIGDSHAVVLAKALANSSESTGIQVGTVAEFKGCLFMKEPFPGLSSEICDEWQNRTLKEIQDSPAETVVLHGYTTGRLTGTKRGVTAPIEILSEDGQNLTDPDDALEAYEIGLANFIGDVVEGGKRVIIVSSVPDFSEPLPYDLPGNRTSVFSLLTGTNKELSLEDMEIVPLEQAINRNYETLQREVAVASQFEHVTVLDPLPYICGPIDCRQWRNQDLVYSDLDHLTLSFASTALAPELLRLAAEGR